MPQDEPVDIIDEKENLLEVVTKGLAHEKGLLHKTVRGHAFFKSKDVPTCPVCWPGRYKHKI